MSDGGRKRREIQLENARARYPVDDLSDALADLHCGFGTYFEFPSDEYAVQDTPTFDAAHPGHPLHSDVRWRRQEAASFFWMLGEGDPSAITAELLPELHRSLFDASAAVRYDIAMCLGHANHPESGPHLQRLIETEPTSDMVRSVARWALSGDDARRYGASIGEPSASELFRRPEDSEIRRDRMHTRGISAEPLFNLLWAACAWELAHDLATNLTRENFAILCATDFTFRSGVPDAEPQRLHTSWLRMFRRQLDQMIADHAARTIRAKEVDERITSTLQGFKLWGHHDYYAGHESGIRLRLLEAMRRSGIEDRQSDQVLSGEAHRLAAYYLAFTDFERNGVPAEISSVPRTDVRAFVSHSSSDKECARLVADALQTEGIKVWLDERELRVGDSLWDEIGRGIDNADFMLLLVSPRSVASPWVKRELNAGLATELAESRKIVLPVLIETTEVPVFLRERLYCDLGEGFDSAVAELLRAML